jgi:hypothetical protein
LTAIKKYAPFLLSTLMMWVVLLIIYPHYQYYIDPDGTAYLTISKRYAAGDWEHAINGYWSPWSCWLTAILIRLGIAAIPASVVVNTLGATGFLFMGQSFFLRFSIKRNWQWACSVALAILMCYAIFWQSFDDLWECFFLLATLRIILADKFTTDRRLWVSYALIGALAYFAKAYSFPFFILNTLFCVYLLCKDNKVLWLRISAVTILLMAFFAHFWIHAISHKYGFVTTSTAGPLNTSWYLVGHPYWKPGIGQLLPPPYPDSPYYWEDPWFVNGDTPHFWNSWHLFGLQLLRVGLNIWKFILSSLQLSILFLVVVGYAKWMLIWQRKVIVPTDRKVLMWSMLLFTVGYLPVNFEARYLWYMVPLSMVIGVSYLQQMKNSRTALLLGYFFAASFALFPLYGLHDLYDKGRDEYITAQYLKRHNIVGAFTAEANAKDVQKIARIAYFSGDQYYNIPARYIDRDTLMQEAHRYGIRFCLYLPGHRSDAESAPVITDPKLVDNSGKAYPVLTNDSLGTASIILLTQ